MFLFATVLVGGVALWVADPFAVLKTDEGTSPGGNDGGSSRSTDRDNAAEEVRAVATRIANIEQRIELQNAQAQDERDRIQSELASIADEVDVANYAGPQTEHISRLIVAVDTMTERLDSLERRQFLQPSDSETYLPDGQALVWHASADFGIPLTDRLDIPLDSINFPANATGQPFVPQIAENPAVENAVDDEHYTIPPTTTLLNATALTALVGRIPVRGRLEDPWRFKIITGAENLAANGHRIPEIYGMLWSGTARGDYALSCVSGTVDTAAFIFADGTIQTVKTESDAQRTTSGLGWLSDERGNPCISGELMTNATRFLAQSTLVNSAAATAQAVANAQVTSRTNSTTGETAESLTGDLDEFVLGRAAEDALSSVSRWLEERQQNSFDAVYVPAGQTVAIHIETPIEIDYSLDGRKVKNFATVASTGAHLGGLD